MALKFEASRIESTDTDPIFIDFKYWERTAVNTLNSVAGDKVVILKLDHIYNPTTDKCVSLKSLYESRVPGVRRRESTMPTTVDYPHTYSKTIGGKNAASTLYTVTDIHLDTMSISANPSLIKVANFASGSSSSGHEMMMTGGNGSSYRVYKRRFILDVGDIYHQDGNVMGTQSGRYISACSNGSSHFYTAVRTYNSPENGDNQISQIRYDDMSTSQVTFTNTLTTPKYDACAEISEDNVEMIIFGGNAQLTASTTTNREVEKIHVDDSAYTYEGTVLAADAARAVSGTYKDQIIAIGNTGSNYFKLDGTSYLQYASTVPTRRYNMSGVSDGISSFYLHGGGSGGNLSDEIQKLAFDDNSSGITLANTMPEVIQLANTEGGY